VHLPLQPSFFRRSSRIACKAPHPSPERTLRRELRCSCGVRDGLPIGRCSGAVPDPRADLLGPPRAARNCRGLCGLGTGQQSHPQGVAVRSLQIVQFKGLTAGPFLLALGLLAGDALPGLTMAAVAGTIGFLGPVRGGPATARCCPDRCLFLDRAVPGRCRGHPVPARATDLPVAGGRSSDGHRCLAAPN
jgi:hypothetical protein